ncbi:integrase DNA-binding domain-containing protein, partial [Streptococcus equi]|uniref:integrase DNA-binding domain-containing protein n=1 Tax=Streptococcus equi TaxID=1336 RepID=UPI001969F936
MSEKRRDNKNRILRTGESQRKDGRYVYKYVDVHGKQKFVYAWTLVPTDRTPVGKRPSLCLRDKEKIIQQELADGIHSSKQNMTVSDLYLTYIRYKGNVRDKTKIGRQQFYKILSNDLLGTYR